MTSMRFFVNDVPLCARYSPRSPSSCLSSRQFAGNRYSALRLNPVLRVTACLLDVITSLPSLHDVFHCQLLFLKADKLDNDIVLKRDWSRTVYDAGRCLPSELSACLMGSFADGSHVYAQCSVCVTPHHAPHLLPFPQLPCRRSLYVLHCTLPFSLSLPLLVWSEVSIEEEEEAGGEEQDSVVGKYFQRRIHVCFPEKNTYCRILEREQSPSQM
jgi:hypothetical protein